MMNDREMDLKLGCRWRRAIARIAPAFAAALCLLLGAAGCDTIGQDVNDMTSMLKPTSPTQAAKMMIDPYNADNRREGTLLISNSSFGGIDVYLALYRDMVDHERDPIVRAIAIRALARHGQPEDAMRILPHLTDENVQVRWEAAKGLQRLHIAATVSDLLKVLNNEGEKVDVRIAAAAALGQYPEDRVFQGLLNALDERELSVNLAAAKSLETLTGQSFGLETSKWYAWYKEVAPSGNAFAGHADYLYPTYWREDSFWEKLAFWSHRNFEKPAPPAGLRPKSERSTYGDEDKPPANSDSGG